jgi:hypothetical protein
LRDLTGEVEQRKYARCMLQPVSLMEDSSGGRNEWLKQGEENEEEHFEIKEVKEHR